MTIAIAKGELMGAATKKEGPMTLKFALELLKDLEVQILELAIKTQAANDQRKKVGKDVFEIVRRNARAGASYVEFSCGGVRYGVDSKGILKLLDKEIPAFDEDVVI